MENELVFLIDDTNDYTFEDLDAFEKTLSTEYIESSKAKVREILDGYSEPKLKKV